MMHLEKPVSTTGMAMDVPPRALLAPGRGFSSGQFLG
jgi:hypothetical protein